MPRSDPRRDTGKERSLERRGPATPQRKPEPTGASDAGRRVDKPGGASGPWKRVGARESEAPSVSLRMQARLDERKRTERRRAASKTVRAAVIAAFVLATMWAVSASPLLALDSDKIELTGVTSEIDAAAVDAVLASHDGDSLLTLNVPHVADQLRDVAGVRDATVERVWPRGLRVTLVARQPVAAIPSGEQFALLDADAVQVGLVDAPPAGLPVVNVPLGDERVLNAALTVIKSLPAEILERVDGLGAQTEDSVAFTLRDGPRVEWGSAEDSALKAQVLAVMLDNGQTQGAAVVDVSAPTLPITRAEG